MALYGTPKQLKEKRKLSKTKSSYEDAKLITIRRVVFIYIC